MIYIPANENLCAYSTGAEVEYTPGKSYTGVRMGAASPSLPAPTISARCRRGTWTPASAYGPTITPRARTGEAMLATAGGVVFTGGTSDRRFHAFDASTGKLLWEFPTNSGILAPPTSFAIDGKQYIAVLSGWGGDSRGMQGNLNRLFPGEYPEVPEGGAVWVFALE